MFVIPCQPRPMARPTNAYPSNNPNDREKHGTGHDYCNVFLGIICNCNKGKILSEENGVP